MSDGETKRCILCDTVLDEESDSREHLIANSIGGQKRVLGLLCEECNNDTGATWDREIAEQFAQLCVLFAIERDRGDVRPQEFETQAGEQVLLDIKGKMKLPEPEVKKDQTDDGLQVRITAPDVDKAREIVEGFARKYPGLDLQAALEEMEEGSVDPGPLKFTLPEAGLEFGRSVVKSPLALIVSIGRDPHRCEHAIEFLRNDDGEPCFGYFYERDVILDRPEGVPLHCVHVEADSETGLIVAYVELFGYLRIVMGLSTSYSGDSYVATHAIDPTSGSELDLEVALNLTKEDLQDAYDYRKYDPDAISEAINAVLRPAIKTINENAKERAIDEAVRYAFENCGAKEGEVLTDEQYERMVELVLERLEPWIIRQVKAAREARNHDR